MKRAIALLRVSTAEQAADERAGLPAQRDAIARTAAREHLQIIDTVTLIDVSGAAVLQAPEMQNLLRRIKDPEIHGVVAKEFSRLMRPEKFDDFVLLGAFADSGTVLYLPDGPVDLASRSGYLLGGFRALMAGEERRQLLERMRDGKEALRRQGKNPDLGCTLPTGITYDRRTGWAVTDEIARVQALFLAVANGEHNYRRLGEQFGFAANSVPGVLTNEIYTGWRVWKNYSRSTVGAGGRQGGGKRTPRPETEVIRVRVFDTAPINSALWTEVNQIVQAKRQRTLSLSRPLRNREHFTYTGHLWCGRCNQILYGRPVIRRQRITDYYFCRSRMTRYRRLRHPCGAPYLRRSDLEPVLDALIGDALQREDFLADVLRECTTVRDRYHDRDHVTARLGQFDAKRQRLKDALFDGLIDRAEYTRRAAQVESEHARFTEILSSMAQEEPVRLDELHEAVQVFAEWLYLAANHRRNMLTAIRPRIFVEDYAVTALELPGTSVHTTSDADDRPRIERDHVDLPRLTPKIPRHDRVPPRPQKRRRQLLPVGPTPQAFPGHGTSANSPPRSANRDE